jgi:hypothetical protein
VKYSSQFKGKVPQEHVEPEKIPSNRKSEFPSKIKVQKLKIKRLARGR